MARGELPRLRRSAGPKRAEPQVKLTHEQVAALAGSSRETTTKILNEYADQGLVSLGRGRINIIDADRMKRAGGL